MTEMTKTQRSRTRKHVRYACDNCYKFVIPNDRYSVELDKCQACTKPLDLSDYYCCKYIKPETKKEWAQVGIFHVCNPECLKRLAVMTKKQGLPKALVARTRAHVVVW